jgi:hypothetical protein
MSSMGLERPPAQTDYEVDQDAVIELVKNDKVRIASGCSLSVSNPILRDIYLNLGFLRSKLCFARRRSLTARKSSVVSASFPSTPQLRWTSLAT